MNPSRRSATWFELVVTPPVVGTVFVHVYHRNKPMIITEIDNEENIHRVDMKGEVIIWGSMDDWREEYRKRMIEVVYDPSKFSNINQKAP